MLRRLGEKSILSFVRQVFPDASLVSAKKSNVAFMNLVYDVSITNPRKRFILKVSELDPTINLSKESFMFSFLHENGFRSPKVFWQRLGKREVQLRERLPGRTVSEAWPSLNRQQGLAVSRRAS